MTKIYLVCGYKVNQLGRIINAKEYIVDRVFTNKKLAQECANWLNEEWRKNLEEIPSPDKIWYYYSVRTEIISKINYKDLPF